MRRRRYFERIDPLKLISEQNGATSWEADAWLRLQMGSPEFWPPAQRRAALKHVRQVRRLLDSLEFNDPDYLTLVDPAAVEWWRRHAPTRKGSAAGFPWVGIGLVAYIAAILGCMALMARFLGR
jgi:hypothetical protein